MPDGSNTADWSFTFLRRKIHAVLFSHMDADPRGVISMSDKCGFKAYRLLHKEYDPITSDTEYMLLENVFKIATWTCKNSTDEHAAFREAEKRLTELSR